MAADLENICVESYWIWRKNPQIAIPFALKLILQVMVIMALSTTLFFAAAALDGAALALAVLFILGLMFVSYYLLEAYFYAGAIGMAKAAEGRKAVLGDMWNAGARSVKDLFLIWAGLGLVLFAAAFILVFLPFLALELFPGASFIIRGFVELGMQVLIVLSMVISLLFVLAPYAIVFDGKKALDSLRESYSRVMADKIRVLLAFFFLSFVSQYIITAVFLAGLFLLSVGLLALPLPPGILTGSLGSVEVYAAQALAQVMVYVLALLAALALTTLFILVFFIQPFTTILWAKFYSGGEI